MSALLLDTGALLASERGDPAMAARLRIAERNGLDLRTTGAVIAESWRDSRGRQAVLARLLKAIDIQPVDEQLGKQAGVLLGKAKLSDVVDATVVALAAAGDRIVTSDATDIRKLAVASGRSVFVIPC